MHGRFPDGPEVFRSVPLLEFGGVDERPELLVFEDLHPRSKVLGVLARDEDVAVQHIADRSAPPIELALPLVVGVVGDNEGRTRLTPIDVPVPPHLIVQRKRFAVVQGVEVDAAKFNLAVGVDGPEIEPVAVLLVHRRRPDGQADVVGPVGIHLARGHGVLDDVLDVGEHRLAIAIGPSLPLHHHDRLIGIGEQADVELGNR